MSTRTTPLFRVALAAIVMLATMASAQAKVTVRSNSIDNGAMFGIEFPGDASLYGIAAMVYSVSLQEYQSGPYLVTEMVIDVAGVQSQYRIYATEIIDNSDLQKYLPEEAPGALKSGTGVPPAVQKLINKGKDTAEQTEGALVIKDYPIATHAKTIEFRLANKADVLDLYKEFSRIYLRKKSRAIVRDEGETLGSPREEEASRLGGTLFSFR